jgi:AraC-like DNA-binding protein
MQSVLKALHEDVLPTLSAGLGQIIPCAARLVALEEPFTEMATVPSDRHNFYEWCWLLSGRAYMKIEECIYVMEPGDICFLPPQIRHIDVCNEATPAYRSLWFSYHRDQFNGQIFEYEPVAKWEIPAYEPIVYMPQLAGLLTALQSEIEGSRPYNGALQHGLMIQLASLLARGLQEAEEAVQEKSQTGNVSRRVLSYLEEHHARELTLAELGRTLCLSPNYLASRFKRETNRTIFEALGDIRLRHAKQMLLEGALPIHAIAKAVGFQNTSQFSHFFRRKTGISPSHYGHIN